MNCREFGALLVYLAFGELPPEQRGRLEEHLGRCPRCAGEWRDYQEVICLARQLPPAPLPLQLEVRLQTLVADWQQRKRGWGD